MRHAKFRFEPFELLRKEGTMTKPKAPLLFTRLREEFKKIFAIWKYEDERDMLGEAHDDESEFEAELEDEEGEIEVDEDEEDENDASGVEDGASNVVDFDVELPPRPNIKLMRFLLLATAGIETMLGFSVDDLPRGDGGTSAVSQIFHTAEILTILSLAHSQLNTDTSVAMPSSSHTDESTQPSSNSLHPKKLPSTSSSETPKSLITFHCTFLITPQAIISTTINEYKPSSSTMAHPATAASQTLHEQGVACVSLEPLPLEAFTLFPKLPVELRYLIWKRACFHRRDLHIGLHTQTVNTRQPLVPPAAGLNIYTCCFSRTPVPSVLHVNHESRAEGLKWYDLDCGIHKKTNRVIFGVHQSVWVRIRQRLLMRWPEMVLPMPPPQSLTPTQSRPFPTFPAPAPLRWNHGGEAMPDTGGDYSLILKLRHLWHNDLKSYKNIPHVPWVVTSKASAAFKP
ncbi:uncharacterized protein PAC_15906 [Phialocephala subalpina]|uniref:2EXR domain-containing protein n=1 Tax=Phialocephala subalpina TaxID=576137 RepID=A0A1L7XM23_9HELO|nr:uncharacterized protein PAC_15906 [Phialocephala subalpina]